MGPPRPLVDPLGNPPLPIRRLLPAFAVFLCAQGRVDVANDELGVREGRCCLLRRPFVLVPEAATRRGRQRTDPPNEAPKLNIPIRTRRPSLRDRNVDLRQRIEVPSIRHPPSIVVQELIVTLILPPEVGVALPEVGDDPTDFHCHPTGP